MINADPRQAHVVKELEHSAPIISCRFDPTGAFIFASAEDYAVQRWRLSDGKKVSYPPLHDSWVGALCFSADGRNLMTGGFDGRIKWWPAGDDKPKAIRSVDAHAGWVRALAVNRDGKLLASGGNDHRVKLWSAADGTLLREMAGHKSHVYSVLFHPDGKSLLSGDLQGEICHWDSTTGKLIRKFDAKPLHTYEGGQRIDYGGVRSMAFTADGRHLAAGGLYKASNPLGAVNEPLVLLFQWSDQKKIRQHVIGGTQGLIWRVVAHPDGFLIGGSSGASGGIIAFWKPEADKEFFKLQLPNYLRDLDLHPDGLRLAATHHDRKVRIVRMAAGNA